MNSYLYAFFLIYTWFSVKEQKTKISRAENQLKYDFMNFMYLKKNLFTLTDWFILSTHWNWRKIWPQAPLRPLFLHPTPASFDVITAEQNHMKIMRTHGILYGWNTQAQYFQLWFQDYKQ